jgi:hypothetical protein
MRSDLIIPFLAAVSVGIIAADSPALAQTKVKTETIQVAPVEEAPAEPNGTGPDGEPTPGPTGVSPQVHYDISVLPPPVARMRAQIMEAAQTGDVERLRPVLEANELPPTFSFGDETDPIEHWKAAAGDPDGREILAIMIEILEAGFVHLDAGTPQEMYVWPYFYGLPLDSLTPSQEVELYKLITPHDRQGMEDFGAYIFYRLGIGPDGTWHFFVAGD